VHLHTAPRICIATIQLLRQETPDFIAPNLCPDLNPVDYQIWAAMQHRVYHRQIHSEYELKQWLINVWCGRELAMLILAISISCSVTYLTTASLLITK